MRSQVKIGEEYEITSAGAEAREKGAFKNLQARVIYVPDFLVKPDVEKAFIKKYFEYHDIFADAKPVELDEITKAELQSILDAKESEINNGNLERTPEWDNGVINLEQEENKKLELEDLNLSTRAYNALDRTYRANIRTVGDIINLDKKIFYKIRNLGTVTADEVIEKIHSLGLIMSWEKDREDEEVEKKDILDLDEKSKRELRIADLGLPVQIYKALDRAGINNLGSIIDLEEEDFRKKIGRKAAEKVIEKIHSLGLTMSGEEDREDEEVVKAGKDDEKFKTGLLTIELGLSVRSYNCLARAGLDNVDDIIALEEKAFRKIRDLGPKTADEIIEKIHEFGITMSWEKDKSNDDEKLKDSIKELKTAYSNLKAKEKECEELKRKVEKLKKQVQGNLESTKSSEINPNEKNETSEDTKPQAECPSHDEL